MSYNIPPDQASLLSMFIRNLESRMDTTGKNEFQVRQLVKLLTLSNQTLIEPIFTELNFYANQHADTNITLRNVQGEKSEVLSKAEKRSVNYIYLLLGLTVTQFIVFYWTIFHVEWLGRTPITQGWDIMEPLTYTVQLLNVLVAMRFYYKYRNLRGLDQIIKTSREKFISKSPALKFRYLKLEKAEEQLRSESNYIKKSIDYYKSRQKMI